MTGSLDKRCVWQIAEASCYVLWYCTMAVWRMAAQLLRLRWWDSGGCAERKSSKADRRNDHVGTQYCTNARILPVLYNKQLAPNQAVRRATPCELHCAPVSICESGRFARVGEAVRLVVLAKHAAELDIHAMHRQGYRPTRLLTFRSPLLSHFTITH